MDIFDQQQKGSNSDMFLFSRRANSVCVCVFLCSAPAVINSKILTVTVRPEPQPSEPMVMVELSPLSNVSEREERREKKKNIRPVAWRASSRVTRIRKNQRDAGLYIFH